MLPYLIMTFLLMLLGILFCTYGESHGILGSDERMQTNGTLYCVLAASIIIIIVGFRATSVGSDTIIYYDSYHTDNQTLSQFLQQYSAYLKQGFSSFLSDKNTAVFHYICSIAHRSGLSFNGFLTLVAVVYVAPMFYLIRKESTNAWKSCFWFIVSSFSLALSGVRITLAIGITTIAHICLEKQRKALSIALFTLATMIHLSALVFVLRLFLERMHVTKGKVNICIVLFIFAPVLRLTIITSILRFTYYAETDVVGAGWSPLAYIFIAVTTVLAIHYSDRKSEDYCRLMIVGTLLCGMFTNGAIANVHRYYTQYQCILIPSMLQNISNKRIGLLVEMAYIVVGLYSLARAFGPNSPYVPYTFFWQG